MSKFGWSLPPGCGKLPGEDETDEVEAFESYLKKEGRLPANFDQLVEDEDIANLLIDAMKFAYAAGSDASKGDEGEYLYYLETKIREEMNYQGDNIAQAVRAAMQRIMSTFQNRPDQVMGVTNGE